VESAAQRNWLPAILLAPLTASLLFAVFLYAVGTIGGDPLPLVNVYMQGLFSLTYSYGGALLAGMPLVLLLERINRLQIVWLTIGAGALAGVFVFAVHLVVFSVPAPADFLLSLLVYMVLFAPCGAATGLSFGLLARLPFWRT
jgi:hypothetical protein